MIASSCFKKIFPDMPSLKPLCQKKGYLAAGVVSSRRLRHQSLVLWETFLYLLVLLFTVNLALIYIDNIKIMQVKGIYI